MIEETETVIEEMEMVIEEMETEQNGNNAWKCHFLMNDPQKVRKCELYIDAHYRWGKKRRISDNMTHNNLYMLSAKLQIAYLMLWYTLAS